MFYNPSLPTPPTTRDDGKPPETTCHGRSGKGHGKPCLHSLGPIARSRPFPEDQFCPQHGEQAINYDWSDWGIKYPQSTHQSQKLHSRNHKAVSVTIHDAVQQEDYARGRNNRVIACVDEDTHDDPFLEAACHHRRGHNYDWTSTSEPQLTTARTHTLPLCRPLGAADVINRSVDRVSRKIFEAQAEESRGVSDDETDLLPPPPCPRTVSGNASVTSCHASRSTIAPIMVATPKTRKQQPAAAAEVKSEYQVVSSSATATNYPKHKVVTRLPPTIPIKETISASTAKPTTPTQPSTTSTPTQQSDHGAESTTRIPKEGNNNNNSDAQYSSDNGERCDTKTTTTTITSSVDHSRLPPIAPGRDTTSSKSVKAQGKQPEVTETFETTIRRIEKSVVVQTVLNTPVSVSDAPGYIYILCARADLDRFRGTVSTGFKSSTTSALRPAPSFSSPSSTSSSSSPATISVKIGQSTNPRRRVAEWNRQCGTDLVLLLKPSPHRGGMGVVPHVKKVERLVHVSLKELGMHQKRGPCDGCHREHREWFSMEASMDGLRLFSAIITLWAVWDRILSGEVAGL